MSSLDMTYSTLPRPRSQDFDIVDNEGKAVAQIIKSKEGFTPYLLGGLEPLLSLCPTPEAALAGFEAWAASAEGTQSVNAGSPRS